MKNYITKIVGVAFLFVVLSISSKGQTILNGVIGVDSTLSLVNSPYQVTGNIVVWQNVTLTVEPGVIIKFNPNVELLLRGKLVANGTASDTITFTSDIQTPGSWLGLRVDNYLSAKVECSFFKAKYANEFINHRKTVGTDTVIKLTNCLLDSNKWVTYTHQSSNSKQYYYSCVFSNSIVVNQSEAVSSCTYKNCLGFNNTRIYYNTEAGSPPSTIDSCIFHDNVQGLIFLTGSITNSTFFNNGFAIEHGGTGPAVHHCNIYQNNIGIQSTHLNLNPTNQISQNRICNNGTNVELWYSADFNIMNNCWCLSDSAQIRATMHDFFVQSGLGIVNFTPFDTTCSFFTNVQNVTESNSDFQIYPNPVSDNLTLILPTIISMTTLKIFNTLGELEYTSVVTTQETNIDVSTLANGIHILEITNGKNISRRKFIEQKNIR